MNFDQFRNYCLALPSTSEDFPFDEQTLVFRVEGKIFALCDVENFSSINLKCEPELAIQLREEHEQVQPGFHMNKKHWNTIYIHQGLSDKKVFEWILHSYYCVVKTLSKKMQKELALKK